jgi:hypothetical protein
LGLTEPSSTFFPIIFLEEDRLQLSKFQKKLKMSFFTIGMDVVFGIKIDWLVSGKASSLLIDLLFRSAEKHLQ